MVLTTGSTIPEVGNGSVSRIPLGVTRGFVVMAAASSVTAWFAIHH